MTEQNNGTKEMTPASVPYFIYEGALAREERTARRLIILCGILAAALIISNAAWMACL